MISVELFFANFFFSWKRELKVFIKTSFGLQHNVCLISATSFFLFGHQVSNLFILFHLSECKNDVLHIFLTNINGICEPIDSSATYYNSNTTTANMSSFIQQQRQQQQIRCTYDKITRIKYSATRWRSTIWVWVKFRARQTGMEVSAPR